MEEPSGPGSLLDRRPEMPVCTHMDVYGISQVPRRSILCLCPVLRPRPNRRPLAYLTVSSMLPPLFQQRRLQRLMNFGALLRGFSTCCLRFKSDVATTHAKLASGWLARLYREGVEPSGSLQKVSDHTLVPLFWIYPGAMEVSRLVPHFDEATLCPHRAEGVQWLLPGKTAVAADILRRPSVTRTRHWSPSQSDPGLDRRAYHR